MVRCLLFIESPFLAYLELSSSGSIRAPHLPPPNRRADQGPVGVGTWESGAYLETAADWQTLVGWCVSDREIGHVEFWAGGQPVGMARFVHARKDVVACYPDLTAAPAPGFTARLHDPLPDHTRLAVRLVFRDGGCADGLFVLPPPPSGERAVRAASSAESPIRLTIDTAAATDGVCRAGNGGLVIGGWAVAPDGIESVTVSVGGAAAAALTGIKRPDVAAEFPGYPGSEAAGFAFFLDTRPLPPGEHRVEVTVRSPSAARLEHFTLVCDRHGSAYTRIVAGRRFHTHGAHRLRGLAERLTRRIAFVVMVTVASDAGGVPHAGTVDETVRSVVRQAYRDWRLLLVERQAGDVDGAFLAGLPHQDGRIQVCAEGHAGAALEAAFNGEVGADGLVYAVSLEAGDRLDPAALGRLALAADAAGGADLVYGGHDTMGADGERTDPFFKPAWSPDLLLSCNYIGRAGAVRVHHMTGAVAEARNTAFGSLSWWEIRYRACLAAAFAAGRVVRVDDVIVSQTPLTDEAVRHRWGDERTALLGHARTAAPGMAVRYGPIPLTFRCDYPLESGVSVSIIIPTAGSGGLVEGCIRSIRAHTEFDDYEIIVVDHIDPRQRDLKARVAAAADRVVAVDGPFNWSRFNNLAAGVARGRVLLFLNDDTEVITPGWLRILASNALRPEAGAVGAKLLYRDGSVQHNGIVMVPFGGGGRHSFRFVPGDAPGYHGMNLVQRNVSAVTGACLAVRRQVFDAVGGFDEDLPLIHNDSDFCLRVAARGFVNVVCPDARLFHFEAMSRAGLEERPRDPVFWDRWRLTIAGGDPYFSRHLDLGADDVLIDAEPVETVAVGLPLGTRAGAARILAVKLDHVGDFILAVPAFRALRALFPTAEITLLCGPWALPLARRLGIFDRIEPFALFAEASGDGMRVLADGERRAFTAALRSRLYDLAVDFRAPPDTRWVVTEAGARIAAGFGLLGRTPGLDIAVEWEADVPRSPKHTHMAQSLERLVHAIAQGMGDGGAEPAPPAATRRRPPLLAGIPAQCPVAAVHPFCGQDTRTWPLSHFAELCDLLVESRNAWIVLLGSAGDAAACDELIGMVRHPERIVIAAGRVALGGLPDFLAGVDVFIGNNSGPGHMAAAAGIPSVGIYSGVVPPAEYGCAGPQSVVIRRAVVCEPCYISSRAECPRAMACLTALRADHVLECLRDVFPDHRPA